MSDVLRYEVLVPSLGNQPGHTYDEGAVIDADAEPFDWAFLVETEVVREVTDESPAPVSAPESFEGGGMGGRFELITEPLGEPEPAIEPEPTAEPVERPEPRAVPLPPAPPTHQD